MRRDARDAPRKNGNGANLGFEETLWKAADTLRGQVDAAEYKHVVLGLIFLKYISDFILANPPFNVSEWGGQRLHEDPRWRFGAPPVGNANFAWVQHIIAHMTYMGYAGSCSPTARCRPTSRARARFAARSWRPIWWIAWWRCRRSSSTPRRYRPACGF